MNKPLRMSRFGVSAVLAIFISMSVIISTPTHKAEALTTEEIQTQISQLMQLVQALQAQLAALLVIRGAPEGGSVDAQIHVGDTVRTTDTLKVRSMPSRTGSLLGNVSAGAQGKVTEGPVAANGYTWWKVAYPTLTGWSAENWLRLVSNAPTNPNPSPSPTPPAPTPTPPAPAPTPTPPAPTPTPPTPAPTPTPTLTFTASPTSISSGQSSTLSWSTTNATSCTASNGWTGTKATSGGQSVTPSSAATYSLTCTGAGGSVTNSVSVSVIVATTPTPTPTPPTNTPGLAFSEDFSTASAFGARFDHGWSGEWDAGSLWGGNANDWQGDHDMNCGNPNTTSRTIHLSSQMQANDAPFYHCLPGGDPAKGHIMTSVNTVGYVTVWFSPKQTFRNVTKVCWEQNITDLGGRKWTLVNFLTPAEYSGKTDLGFTSADFPASNGPSSFAGAAMNGVRTFAGGMSSYTNGVMNGGATGIVVSDKAARFQHCIIDNGNGTLTTTMQQPNGSIGSKIVPGNIPDGEIRVEFADDSYNPDKHWSDWGLTNPGGLYTWHWDNIQIYTQ